MNSDGQGFGMMEMTLDATISASHKTPTRVNVETSPVSVLELHHTVHSRNRRVELHTSDGSTCILISKTELDALERALEILSDTEEARSMREHLEKLAHATRPA